LRFSTDRLANGKSIQMQVNRHVQAD